TIHSVIYELIDLDGRIQFRLKEPHELPIGGFLVDEASMISKQLDMDLQSFGRPIIFIDDHSQLPPVGSDAGIMAIPLYRLETIHRNGGEIAHFAEHLRKGKSAQSFEGTGKVEVLSPRQVSDKLLLSVDQVICAFNRTRVQKNEHIRRLLGRT